METSGDDNQNIAGPPVEGVAGGGTGYGWNGSGSNYPSSLCGSIDPTKESSTDLVHVWCMLNTANVGQQEMPRPLDPSRTEEDDSSG